MKKLLIAAVAVIGLTFAVVPQEATAAWHTRYVPVVPAVPVVPVAPCTPVVVAPVVPVVPVRTVEHFRGHGRIHRERVRWEHGHRH